MFRLFCRCHLPLMILISVFSVMMLYLGRLYPQSIWQLMLFPAAYILLAALLISLPGRARMPLLAAGCAMAIAAGYLLFPGRLSVLSMPVIGAGTLFFSLSYADKSPADVSPFFYMSTLIVQLATIFLLHFSADQSAVHDTLHALLQSGFVLYLFLLLLSFSRISLNNATLSRYRLPGVISRVCTVLTVCFFALALALSSLPAVISGVYSAFHMLRRGMSQILLFIINLFPSQSVDGLQGEPISMLPAASGVIDQEPSVFAVILEKAAAVLTVIILIAGTFILVRLLIRLLIRLARHLLERLQHYAASVTEDYEDEITDTRQEETDRSLSLLRRRPRLLRHAYPDTPAGEIRRSYARLLRAHGEWKNSSTARENLPSAAAALYERARYSDQPVTPEDAGRFNQETRRL